MTPIASALADTTIGLDVSVKNLTMFPLLAHGSSDERPSEASSEPIVLDEALALGWAHVTEVSEAGSVPELRFVNKGQRAVFILDGEELVGAKQNRVVNLSLLVPPQCTLTIPVSCVEAGRWHHRSQAFAAAPRAQYAGGRAMRMQHVTASMLTTGAYRSDQSAVWDDIAAKSSRLRAHSETGAMEAMFVDQAGTIESFVEGLPPVPAQVGALFAIADRIAGLELFQSPILLRRLLPKIVRSYALDAIDPAGFAPGRPRRRRRGPDGPLRVAVGLFARTVAAAEGKSMPSLGLGRDVRIQGAGLTAAALVHEDHVVHLTAFAA